VRTFFGAPSLKKESFDGKKYVQLKPVSLSQWLLILIIALGVCICLLPFVIILSVSFSDEQTLLRHGYTILPLAFSAHAYWFLFSSNRDVLFSSYITTIAVTAIGAVSSNRQRWAVWMIWIPISTPYGKASPI